MHHYEPCGLRQVFLSFLFFLPLKAWAQLEDLKKARFSLGFWYLPSQTMAVAPACLWLHMEVGQTESVPVLL